MTRSGEPVRTLGYPARLFPGSLVRVAALVARRRQRGRGSALAAGRAGATVGRLVARAASVTVIGTMVLLGPLGQVEGRAAGSLVVTPSTATAPPDEVTLSGECPGIEVKVEDIEVEVAEQSYVTRYPTTLRVTLVGQPGVFEDIALDDGKFTDETFDLPDGLPPGDHTFAAQLLPEPSDSETAGLEFECDPTTTLTILPPDVPATLELDPERGDVGATVTATGTCPTSFEVTDVRFDEAVVGSATVDSSTGVLSAVEFPIPEVDPGSHAVSTSCGGQAPFEVPPPPAIPATLELDPVGGVVGDTVTARGTCPVSSEVVSVSFGGEQVGSADVDPRTGQFGPIDVTVPDVGLGPVTVQTDCGARQTFTVTLPTAPSTSPITTPATTTPGSTTPGGTVPGATTPGSTIPGGTVPGASTPGSTIPGGTAPGATTPGSTIPGGTAPGATTPGSTIPGAITPGATTPPISTPPTTPATATVPGAAGASGRTFTPPAETVTPDGRVRIVVPDLAGLTESEVIAALGDRLTLANPTGKVGRVSSQVPPPRTLVDPASAVSVVLAPDPDPGSSWLPVALVVVAVAGLTGALVYSERLRRRHAREKHWLDSDVRAELQAEEQDVLAVPERSVASLEVRVAVRRDPARLEFQEVGDAHD